MGSFVRVEGLTALVKRVDEIKDMEALKTVIKSNTSNLEQKAKRQTYVSFRKGYTIGDTRDSIHLSIEDGGLTGKVEPGTKYSPYVEHGTRYMEAEPFMKPALNAVASKFEKDVAKLMR